MTEEPRGKKRRNTSTETFTQAPTGSSGSESGAPNATPPPPNGPGELPPEPVTPRDKDGRTFRPDLHETDERGNPVLSPSGHLRKKRGNQPGSNGRSKEAAAAAVATKQAAAAARDQLAARGLTLLCLLPALAMGASSDGSKNEGEPDTAERETLEAAALEYVQAHRIELGGPGLVFLLVLGHFYARRAPMPRTRTFWQRAGEWITRQVQKIRASKSGHVIQIKHERERVSSGPKGA